MVDNKRIAKNTIFLYFRMIIIMAVSLYTSRVVLDKLGVDDYGLYNVVGGVVGMFSFLSGTLSIASSRFITFELGTNNKESQAITFSTIFYTHLFLGIIILIILETGGMWFIYNKLVIPEDRYVSALIVFQISLLTMIVNITQTPYTSTIMAHEKMDVYAYISFLEVFLKLLVVYLLKWSPIDKLVFYAILLAASQFIVAISYRIYSIRCFSECRLRKIFSRKVFHGILSFSGWNLIANVTEVLKMQGIIVLMNLFFAPAIVGAQAIANQIGTAIMQFVSNFRNAVNPQIIKQYAQGNDKKSRQLTLSSAYYSFILVVLLCLPAIDVIEELLGIWLVSVPDYAVLFAKWTLLQKMFGTIDTSLYVPMMASGKVKSNSLYCLFLGIGQFVILYIMLKYGCGVMWVQYMSVIVICIFSFVVKPIILISEIGYEIKSTLICLARCAGMLLLSFLLISLISIPFDGHSSVSIIYRVLIDWVSILFVSTLLMYKVERNYIMRQIVRTLK